MYIWKEGKYVDLWSVIHLLSGIVFTGWMLELGIHIGIIFIMYIVLAVLWEVTEMKLEIFEHQRNIVVDVLIGIVGYLCVFIVRDASGVMSRGYLILFTILYVSMQVHGYLFYRKRKEQFRGSSNIL